jgi:hypothetical protein
LPEIILCRIQKTPGNTKREPQKAPHRRTGKRYPGRMKEGPNNSLYMIVNYEPTQEVSRHRTYERYKMFA